MCKKYIGEIIFRATGEKIIFNNADIFVNTLEEQIFYIGINSVSVKVYKNNFDLKYKIHSVIKGEYGDCEPKAQYIIEKTTPDFRLPEKLAHINKYEEKCKSDKKCITRKSYAFNEVYIADHIANSMPIRKIKKLIDRRYCLALGKQ